MKLTLRLKGGTAQAGNYNWLIWIIGAIIVFFVVDKLILGGRFLGGMGGKTEASGSAVSTGSVLGEFLPLILLPVGGILLAILVIRMIIKRRRRRREPETPRVRRLGPRDVPPGPPPAPVGRDPGDDPTPPARDVMIRNMKDPRDHPREDEYPRYEPKARIPRDRRIIIDTIEPWFLGVRNQQDLGACAAFAGTSIFEYIYNREKKGFQEDAKRSELYLWYYAREERDENSGTRAHRLAEEMRDENGNCEYGLWPFEPLPSRRYREEPSEDAKQDGQQHKVIEWNVLGDDPEDWIKTLADEHPIFIGARMPDNFPYGDFSGSSFDEDPDFPSEYRGHAMVVVGYDSHYRGSKTRNEYFRVRNSWGSDWADNGYIWIKRSTLEEMVSKGSSAWVFIGWNKGEQVQDIEWTEQEEKGTEQGEVDNQTGSEEDASQKKRTRAERKRRKNKDQE